MVRKLFKHECIFYARTIIPIQIILILIAVLNRFVQFFETDTTAYRIVFNSSVVVLVIGIVASLILTSVIMIVRFYKNMFSSEGYLTHTLPVKSSQHIFVKISAVIVFDIISVIGILLAIVISTAGDVLAELIKAAGFLIKQYIESLGANGIFYAIEFFVLLFAATITEMLLIYTCITLGQLFNKNRIFAAIGIYFGLYIITQVISTVITVAGTVFHNILKLEKIVKLIIDHPYASVHWILCIIIAFAIILSAVYFLVIRFVMRRKLNLE